MLSSVESSPPLSFADTIRKIIRVGGCNCSRANMVGACLGANYGFQEVPFHGMVSTPSTYTLGISTDWMLRTDKLEEIFNLALLTMSHDIE